MPADAGNNHLVGVAKVCGYLNTAYFDRFEVYGCEAGGDGI